ncbi:MAG TPA: decarboxylating NADP(+)-dependent phosphogluconate dehydrogenase [Bacteroidota bacterium]|nr:decarboxylating NADP(+)-dependent phosphogluconate dehydrogenase [Bacteroidota bacterium]
MSQQADFGLVGLAVMGENLVLNIESRGYTVAVFNRTVEKVTHFLNGRAQGKKIIGTNSIPELVASLKAPRKVMLMVKAGKPVDEFIEMLIPHLEKGDIIIDGGNSHFPDTIRRTKYLESKGLLFIGTGVSGGEEGALRGPSIMPGGSPQAWPAVKPILQAIAAKVGDTPCCDWVGNDGAGHFVKMVHNGIEYGDMELICECYQLMKEGIGMSNKEMYETFKQWNDGELSSYLIEITRDILNYKDEKKKYVLDSILDTAGQKGTGKWTSVSALDLGIPMTMVSEAVFSRCLSAIKDERVAASKILKGPAKKKIAAGKKAFVEDLRKAMYASKITSYAQGYMLMKEAAKEYQWDLNYGGIALLWRGGCIIRSTFLGKIKIAYDKNPELQNLLLDPYFKKIMASCQESWRKVVATAAQIGIPIPAMSSSLAFYDGYRHKWLPANLLQAQRDYFGAHTYERIDKPRGEFFHTNWTGHGGDTASSTYVV